MAPVRRLSVIPFALSLGLAAAVVRPTPSNALTRSGTCPSASGQDVVLSVPLPGRPRFLLLRERTLWVTVGAARPGGRGFLVRVDSRSGRIERTFPLPVDPSRVAYGFGSLWITGSSATDRYRFPVLRLDPRSGRTLSVIRGPKLFGVALAATSDGIWVGGNDVVPQANKGSETLMRWIFKIDPSRNAVVRSVHLESTTAIELVGDRDALWATGWGAVVKLSASGRLLFQQRFDGAGWSLALTPDAVWISQPFFGTRDPQTQRPARRLLRVATVGPRRVTVLELPVSPGKVSAAGGVVWVGPAIWAEGGALTRIDATRTPSVVNTIESVRPNRIEAFAGGAWVVVRDANVVSKIC